MLFYSYPMLLFLFIISSLLNLNCKHTSNVSDSKDQSGMGNEIHKLDGKIWLVYQDSQGNYWFGGNDKGAYFYNGSSLALFTPEDGLAGTNVISIQEDSKGNIYLDTPQGVSRYDGRNFTTLTVGRSDTTLNEWASNPDDLWFRMGIKDNKVYKLEGDHLVSLQLPQTTKGSEFNINYLNSSFSPYGIYSIYKDKRGHIWFGTASAGLIRFDGNDFAYLFEDELQTTPSGGDFGMRSIIQDNYGDYWINNCKHRYDVEPNYNDTLPVHKLSYTKKEGVTLTNEEKEAKNLYYLAMTQDDYGDIWMVSYTNGVWRNTGSRLIHYPVLSNGKQIKLFSIYNDRQGILWLGTHEHGVYKFNGTQFERFLPEVE